VSALYHVKYSRTQSKKFKRESGGDRGIRSFGESIAGKQISGYQSG